MGARQTMLLVQTGEIASGIRGDMVGLQGGGSGIGEGPTDDLLDAAGVEVDAGAEARHCSGSGGLRM